MKLICPKCISKGEIILVGKDIVAYRCSKCGYVSDIMFADNGSDGCAPAIIVPGIAKRPHDFESITEQVAQLRSEGHGVASIAYMLGVSKNTLYNWAQDNKELRNALGVRTRKVKG